jgi:hypothetical protein
MPSYARRQSAVAIKANRDFKINWDGGIFHGRAGDYLVLTDDGSIVKYTPEEFVMTWAAAPSDAEEPVIEAKLQHAIDTGYW